MLRANTNPQARLSQAWRARRRLCLADLLATPTLLPSAATALELSEDRESSGEGRSTCQCLAVVLDICARRAWSAVQVRCSACFAHVYTVHFACHELLRLKHCWVGDLIARFVLCVRMKIDDWLQECWQNSKRVQSLSALLSAIYQEELFSRDWEEGCPADLRCRRRGSDARTCACPTSIHSRVCDVLYGKT